MPGARDVVPGMRGSQKGSALQAPRLGDEAFISECDAEEGEAVAVEVPVVGDEFGLGRVTGGGSSEGLARIRPPAFESEDNAWPALSFVEDDKFQMFIGLIIGANVLVLAGETDSPSWTGWVVFDNFFVVTFLAEIVLRILHRGIVFFFTKDTAWSILDTVNVVLGIVDSWIEPLLLTAGLTTASGHSSLFRFLRLSRLLRIFRAVKIFPKLMAFVQALVEMFSTMIWIFTFLGIFMICSAIVLTRELGHGEAPMLEDGEAGDDPWRDIREYFRDVPTSLFTLFRVSTQDDWMNIAEPLISVNPAWCIFFVVFITFVSWTMISVLTAVASESMVAATTDRKEQEVRQAELRAKAFIEFLRDAFTKADADGNGVLDKEEFETMMRKEFVITEMRNMGFSMTEEEIVKSWDMLDIDRGGELTIDSFVSGLSYLQEKLTTRHVMNISYLLKRVSRHLEESVSHLFQELDALRDQNAEIIESLHCQEQLRDQQQLSLWLWHQWMRKHDPRAIKDAQPPPLEAHQALSLQRG